MFRLAGVRPLLLLLVGLLVSVGMMARPSNCAESWVEKVLPAEIQAVVVDESVALMVTQGVVHAYHRGPENIQDRWTRQNALTLLGYQVAPRVAICWGQTEAWAFSSELGLWTEQPLQEQVVDCKVCDDIAVVQTGTRRVYAYSALTGSWEKRTPAQNIDSIEVGKQIVLVLAGREIWAYSGFSGRWTGVSLPMEPTGSAVGGRIAVVWTPSTAYALTATDEAWTQTTLSQTPEGGLADEDVALIWSSNKAHCFSPTKASWSSVSPLVVVQGAKVGQGVALVWTGSQAHAYGASTGAWTTTSLTGSSALGDVAAHVAVVWTNKEVHGYSPRLDAWASQSLTGNSPEVLMGDGIGIVKTDLNVVGYSAARGVWATEHLVPGPFEGAASENVAVLWTDTQALAYDGLDAAWKRKAISGTLQSGTAGEYLALIRSSSAVHAYDVLGHKWTSVTVAGGTTGGEAAEQLCVAWSPKRGYGYDAGRGGWDDVTFSGNYTAEKVCGRVAIVTVDQSYVYGFSQANGAWEKHSVGFVERGTKVSENLGVVWGTSKVAIFDPVPQDTDGDGMADWWEDTHRFNILDPTDAAENPDADGQDNLAEFVAGTDPHDPDLVFSVNQALLDGEISLQWQSVPGRRYRVSQSEDLVAWMTVSGVMTAPWDTTEWRRPVATTVTKRFYRVEVIR